METAMTDQPTPDPPAHLHLPAQICDQVVAHLRAALPSEGCGLLAINDEPGATVATHFYPGSSLDRSPTRYTMDPVEVIAAFRDMRERGWRLGAIVHSHPVSPATPSRTDLRESYYPEALMVIASFQSEPPTLRAWNVRTGPAGPTEVTISRDDPVR